jgi:hypothetical protein
MASNEAAALQGIDTAQAEAPTATAKTKGRTMASNKTVVRQIIGSRAGARVAERREG